LKVVPFERWGMGTVSYSPSLSIVYGRIFSHFGFGDIQRQRMA